MQGVIWDQAFVFLQMKYIKLNSHPRTRKGLTSLWGSEKAQIKARDVVISTAIWHLAGLKAFMQVKLYEPHNLSPLPLSRQDWPNFSCLIAKRLKQLGIGRVKTRKSSIPQSNALSVVLKEQSKANFSRDASTS